MKELKDTIEIMCSENYKERFKAEYWQNKIRYEKLCSFVSKYKNDALDFQPNCPLSILQQQLGIMKTYIDILENRANIEQVNLYN